MVQILGKWLPQPSKHLPGTQGGTFCGPGPICQMSPGTKLTQEMFPERRDWGCMACSLGSGGFPSTEMETPRVEPHPRPSFHLGPLKPWDTGSLRWAGHTQAWSPGGLGQR